MKNVLLMGGVGVGLFSATVVGLLAAQGRLNYEGTRGVPLLSMFFSPTEGEEGEGTEGHDDGHGDPHGAGETHGDTHSDGGHDKSSSGSHDDEAIGLQHQGFEVEERLPYSIGASAFNEPETGGHGGGHGEDAGGHGDDAAHDAAHPPAAPHVEKERPKLSPPKDDFEQQMEALYGQNRYQRGSFFKFPKLEGDIGIEELNKYLRAAKVSLDGLEKQRAQLEVFETELQAREQDIGDRERMIADRMQDVEKERAKLDKKIKEFADQVILVQRDELPMLREYAEALASFEPSKAKDLIVQQWEMPEGRTRILKVLGVMETEALHSILAEVELPQLKEILAERMKVVQEREKR